MLTEIYIEALLAAEELADQIWEAWFAGEINDFVADRAWYALIHILLIDLNSLVIQLDHKQILLWQTFVKAEKSNYSTSENNARIAWTPLGRSISSKYS